MDLIWVASSSVSVGARGRALEALRTAGREEAPPRLRGGDDAESDPSSEDWGTSVEMNEAAMM